MRNHCKFSFLRVLIGFHAHIPYICKLVVYVSFIVLKRLVNQIDMKRQYCTPETEVDFLVLEDFVLYPTTPVIEDDLDDPDDITW